LQRGDALSGFFVPFKGYDQAARKRDDASRRVRTRGKGTVTGEILMRRRLDTEDTDIGPAGDLTVLAHLPLAELPATRSLRAIRSAVFGERRPSGPAAARSLYYLAQDSAGLRKLSAEARKLVRKAAGSGLPGDFRHSVVGRRRGNFNYGLKHGLTEFSLDSSLTPSERLELAIDRLGTSANAVEVKASRDKMMRLEVANKLGVAGDHIRVAVDRIPVTTSAPLQLNLKPGLGGLEVIAGGTRVDARVEVTAVIDRKTIRRSFRLPLEGGTRLKLSNVLSQRALGVSRIDNLLGPARDTEIILSTR
jgi:hypothetical protein